MTSVKFFADNNNLCGFEISGHSSIDCDDEIGKIVCSAVSSAAYLTANTITEFIGDNIDAVVDDALMKISVSNPSKETVILLKGLKFHLEELSNQYSSNIRIYGGANHVKD